MRADLVTDEHVRESNLIESIDDPEADRTLAEAWHYLAAAEELTLPVLLETHRIVTAATLGEDAGRLRRCNVVVDGRRCPDWREVPGLVDEWLSTMHRWPHYDPRERHIAFERAHPFRDGNGRAGRLLWWWHEIRIGRPPTLIRASERWDYYDWFGEPERMADLARRWLHQPRWKGKL